MHDRLISVVTLILLAVTAMQVHQHDAQSATFTMLRPTAVFVPSTARAFDQLMGDAMSAMHKRMHSAPYTGEPWLSSPPARIR